MCMYVIGQLPLDLPSVRPSTFGSFSYYMTDTFSMRLIFVTFIPWLMVLTRMLCTHMFYFLKLSSLWFSKVVFSLIRFFITLLMIYFMLFYCSQTEAFIQRPQSIHSIQSCRRILSGTRTHSVSVTDAHAGGRCILVPDSHVRQIPSWILQRTTGKIWTFICAYTDL